MHVAAELRRRVALRADHLCEYCLLHESDSFFGCEVDHIISEKHGGETGVGNLAYACLFCNRNKGSDIATLVPGTERLIRLFHPRAVLWKEHFRYLGGAEALIEPLTEIGEATVRLLGFNDVERCLERRDLTEVGRYPTLEARTRMS
jgi:hypothetical protein